MMSMINAHEREVAEWTAFVARADKRSKMKDLVVRTGSSMAVMEVVLRHESF